MSLKDGAALVGVGLNFVANALNWRRTTKVRTDSLKLDEFKRLRVSVDSAVSELKAVRLGLKGLEAFGGNVQTLRSRISKSNQEAVESYGKLADALLDLDRSKHVTGQDWSSSISEKWDDVCGAFDGAYVQQKDSAAIKESVKRITVKIDQLITVLHEKLDGEIK